VTAIHHGSTAAVIQVGVGDGVIQSTRDHRFQVPGQGWVAARDLQPGDPLAQPDGTRVALQAAALLRLPAATPTYNLTVAEVSTYFVHVAGYSVWVHNESPPPEGFDRTLYWLFTNSPGLRGRDKDGMSLWQTNSWEDVQKFMQVRVDEGQISSNHALYTENQIEQLSSIGLRAEPTPGQGAMAQTDLQHFSVRLSDGPTYAEQPLFNDAQMLKLQGIINSDTMIKPGQASIKPKIFNGKC
ncbi:MAG: HINT domain-containing protein, partial [Chloroflexota bacterium]|nr:HINT domain-containing protein [Chloroflexota bacterium]